MGKQSKRKSFIFNVAWQEVLMEYPPEVRLEVYDAIIRYVASGKLSELKPLAKMAFSFIKNEIDYNNDRYDETVAKRSEAGRKGGGNPNFKKGQRNPYYPTDNPEFIETNKDKQDNQTLTTLTDNVYDYDNDIKKTSSTTKQKKDDGDAESQGEAVSETGGDPPTGVTVPAAQEEKKVAPKKEEAGGESVRSPADARLGTEEIIAEIEGREITAEQLAMLNGLSPEQWRQVKAEIFAQWRFEDYSRTSLQDALNHFANLVRKKAEAIRGKPVPKDRERDFDAMLAGMLATARSPEQQQADDERFKQDFGL